LKTCGKIFQYFICPVMEAQKLIRYLISDLY
jgi:hypothetical protein